MLVTPRKLFYSHEKLSTQSNSIATRITFFCIFCFLHDFISLYILVEEFWTILQQYSFRFHRSIYSRSGLDWVIATPRFFFWPFCCIIDLLHDLICFSSWTDALMLHCSILWYKESMVNSMTRRCPGLVPAKPAPVIISTLLCLTVSLRCLCWYAVMGLWWPDISTLILVFPNDIIPEVSWFVLIKRWTP